MSKNQTSFNPQQGWTIDNTPKATLPSESILPKKGSIAEKFMKMALVDQGELKSTKQSVQTKESAAKQAQLLKSKKK